MQKKKLFFAGALLCVIGAVIALYLYQKPRTSLADVEPVYRVDAGELYNFFQQNESKANQQFLEKVILVKGKVDNVQVTDSTISLLLSSGSDMGGINCSIAKANTSAKEIPAKGGMVQVKGRCIGFLMDVNLVDAIIEH